MRHICLLAIALLAACAGTVVKPVSTPAQDAATNGIRYYEAAPFLLVYSDGKGNVISQIKFLPDVTTKRSIDPFAFLAQNETTLTFTNGVLSQSKTVVDETVVPKAIVSALEKIAVAAMAAADAPLGFNQVDVPLPRLYKIVITATDVVLEGGSAFSADGTKLDSIRAAITDPGKPATVVAPGTDAGEAKAKADAKGGAQ